MNYQIKLSEAVVSPWSFRNHQVKTFMNFLPLLNGRRIFLHRATAKNCGVEDEHCKELFMANAVRFWECRDRILKDSRLFLTPIPFFSFAYPMPGRIQMTLGSLIEFWEAFPESRIKVENGDEYFVVKFSGSALSGMNSCLAINAEGDSMCVEYSPFAPVYRNMYDIASRYSNLAGRYAHNSLEEAVMLLGGIQVLYSDEDRLK